MNQRVWVIIRFYWIGPSSQKPRKIFTLLMEEWSAAINLDPAQANQLNLTSPENSEPESRWVDFWFLASSLQSFLSQLLKLKLESLVSSFQYLISLQKSLKLLNFFIGVLRENPLVGVSVASRSGPNGSQWKLWLRNMISLALVSIEHCNSMIVDG